MITRWQKKLKKLGLTCWRAKFCSATNVRKHFAPNENSSHTQKSQPTNETKHNSSKGPDGTSEQIKMCNLNDAVSCTFIHLSI